MDQYIACGRQPAESTKSSILEISLKDSRAKFLKELKASFYKTILVEASNKAYRKKKKDQHNHDQKH